MTGAEEYLHMNGSTSIDYILSNSEKYHAYSDEEFESMIYFGDSPRGNDAEMLSRANVPVVMNPYKLNIILTILKSKFDRG